MNAQGANVTHISFIHSLRALIPCALIALASPAQLLAQAPPAPTPPAPPSAPRAGGNGELEAQLEAARRNLEQAARDVAELSSRLSTSAMGEIKPLLEPGHAIIGVQLEPTDDGVGARVREVSPGGPAAAAGIHAGDVIMAVNGTALSGAQPARQVLDIMRSVQPESRVNVRVQRDGKPREFTVTARASPGLFLSQDLGLLPPSLPGTFMFHRPLMDMELATLTPRLGSYFGADKGVLVVRAPAGGTMKLEDGDVILAIDGRQPTSGSHATRILGSYQPGEKITLRIVRQHKTMEFEATLPEDTIWQRDTRLPADHDEAPPGRKVIIFGNGAA
jgi:predicted metalloprotease with PDZ domain